MVSSVFLLWSRATEPGGEWRVGVCVWVWGGGSGCTCGEKEAAVVGSASESTARLDRLTEL